MIKTTTEELAELVSDFNNMVVEGRIMEAIEKYYHEDIVIKKEDGSITAGKIENMLMEWKFRKSLVDYGTVRLCDSVIGENVSMIVWNHEYIHRLHGQKNYNKVFVHKWKQGKIIKIQTFRW